jgi:hypothetical protein
LYFPTAAANADAGPLVLHSWLKIRQAGAGYDETPQIVNAEQDERSHLWMDGEEFLVVASR